MVCTAMFCQVFPVIEDRIAVVAPFNELCKSFTMTCVNMICYTLFTLKRPAAEWTLVGVLVRMYPQAVWVVKLLLADVAPVHVLGVLVQMGQINGKIVKLSSTESTHEIRLVFGVFIVNVVRGLLVAVGRCNTQVRLSLIYVSGNLLDLRYLGSL